MRKSLFSAAAAAPLALMAAAPTFAATTISGTTSNPVQTATANNGQPDDVTVSGSITLPSNATPPATAVILNSNNALTNSGSINIKDVNAATGVSATGVQINGGFTGSFTNGGSVIINETYAPKDSNNDGVVDGPWAQGQGRYGVRVVGPGTFTGGLNLLSGGAVTVQGNNSYGVSVETPVAGDVVTAGTISLTGDNGVGLNIAAPVLPNGATSQTGKVLITGAVTASGQDSTAVSITGDVSGRVSIYSAMTATGFHQTTRSTDPAVNNLLIKGGANNDFYIAGPTVVVGANVGGGVFIGAPPAGTSSSDTTTDKDQDGIVDSVQGTGTVTSYGPSPAMVVGSTSRAITLGQVGPGTGVNPYGLIIEGTVTSTGVFDGYGGQGLQIGTSSGNGVTIQGGVHVIGTVSSQGYEADSTAIHVYGGAQFPLLLNNGTISAGDQTLTAPTTATNATAVLIEPNASVQALTNTGSITSAMTSDTGNAAAVIDRSGSITSVLNEGTISTVITPAALNDVAKGSTTALDLRANTTGVSLVQQLNPSPPPVYSTSSSGAVTSSPGVAVTPTIAGDIYFGSGPANVQLLAGTITGQMSFGGNGNTLNVNGGTYTGALVSSTGGPIGMTSLSVDNGALQDNGTTAIQTGTLTVGSKGVLMVSADPTGNAATEITASQSATFTAGAQLGLHLVSLIPVTSTNAFTFTAISSPQLSIGSSTPLTGVSPYLYVTGIQTNAASGSTPGTVVVSVRRRTAAEAGLNKAEAAAYDPIYSSLALDSDIQRAFLAQTTQPGLVSMIDQMLPDHAGGVFRALQMASEQQGVAAGEPPIGQDQEGPTRAWTQEIVLSERKDIGQASGYKVLGFSAVGGIESVSAKGDALGVKFGFVTSNVNNPDLPSDNLLGVSQLSAGTYWRGDFGPLRADAQLGAGFIWVNNRREFLYSDSVGVVHRTATADWSGYSVSARAGLEYMAEFGAFFLEPRVHADYFRLHESGYTEDGGGQGFDLAVAGRTGDAFTVTGSVVAGLTYGSTGFHWRPEVEVGYRAVVSGSAGDTTANFIGQNDPFTLVSESIKEGSAIGRVGLHVYANYLDLLLDAGAQYNKDYTDIDVHLTARTVF